MQNNDIDAQAVIHPQLFDMEAVEKSLSSDKPFGVCTAFFAFGEWEKSVVWVLPSLST